MKDTDKVVGCRGYRDILRRGLTSYWEALRLCKEAEAYHGERSRTPFSDGFSSKPFPSVEIPLLWGTF